MVGCTVPLGLLAPGAAKPVRPTLNICSLTGGVHLKIESCKSLSMFIFTHRKAKGLQTKETLFLVVIQEKYDFCSNKIERLIRPCTRN